MTYQMKQFSQDEKILRVWDVEEIKSLVARYAFLEAGNERERILDELWVSGAESAASASLGRNWGFYVGMENIRGYYVGRNRFGAVGTGIMHPFTTKMVGLSEDRKTAQGLWMSVCHETAKGEDGKLHGYWIAEKTAIDFLLEEGRWKIWHLFIATGLCAHAGANYHALPLVTEQRRYGDGNPAWYMVGKTNEETTVALWDQLLDCPEREAFGTPTIRCEAYSSIYNDQMWFPGIPEHYRTFADVVSYDYQGWRSVAGTGLGRIE